jgi:hypothetical protein
MSGPLKAADFQVGDKVLYVPNHAHGDPNHKDCERGIVSSQNGVYVFVRYLLNGNVKFTAQATSPENLIRRNKL